MRILMVTHNYPRFAGDHAGSFVARLASGLVSRGHVVRVVAPHAPDVPTSEVVDGVEIRRFRFGTDGMERVAYRGDLHQRSAFDPSAIVGIPAMLLAYAAAVRRESRQFLPNVIHAHWWFPGGAFAVRSRTPTVITCHGSDVRLLDRGGPLLAFGRATLRRAAAVTCVSEFLTRDVTRIVPELQGQVRTIYMPLDLTPFERVSAIPKVDPPVILFVGNLVPSKGTSVLLDAFAALHRGGVRCTLRIVGRGAQEAVLRQQARALGIDAQVEWAGFVPQGRIASEYAAATVVALPSRGQAEGLGLVLAEALLSGTAVVASPAGGIPEVVRDGETGLIARDGDAAHLAAQIRRLLEDPGLRERLTAAGSIRARGMFSLAVATDAFERVYAGMTHSGRS